MNLLKIILLFIVSTGIIEAQSANVKYPLETNSQKLAQDILILDTHIDLPYEMNKDAFNVSVKGNHGEFDYRRAIEGGLNAAFMSIYIPVSYENNGAKKYADTLIFLVKNIAREFPNKFKLAYSSKDVLAQFSPKVISLPMGMENGAPIEGDLNNLKYFYDKGIRYITLCHMKNNHICDSSGDETAEWNGLSPFGKKVIAEMNKLGIMIDISHVSDSTFYQVIRLTKTPVIASHSACRIFTPGFPRNMTDDMIKKLGENGGVIQIFFGSDLVNNDVRLKLEEADNASKKFAEENNLKQYDPKVKEFYKNYKKEHPFKNADVDDVIKHIDHVVKIAGIDHVGLGSDFDGTGLLPEGLMDVSFYPNIISALAKKGYSEEDIKKICGGNLIRVWSEVESNTYSK